MGRYPLLKLRSLGRGELDSHTQEYRQTDFLSSYLLDTTLAHQLGPTRDWLILHHEGPERSSVQ